MGAQSRIRQRLCRRVGCELKAPISGPDVEGANIMRYAPYEHTQRWKTRQMTCTVARHRGDRRAAGPRAGRSPAARTRLFTAIGLYGEQPAPALEALRQDLPWTRSAVRRLVRAAARRLRLHLTLRPRW
jgi:hypothetical protein